MQDKFILRTFCTGLTIKLISGLLLCYACGTLYILHFRSGKGVWGNMANIEFCSIRLHQNLFQNAIAYINSTKRREGEWQGEPSRLIWIDKTTLQHDTWNLYIHNPRVKVFEPNNQTAIRVIPNPASNLLNIERLSKTDHLRHYDMTGQIIFETRVNGFSDTFNANHLQKEIFILHIMAENGISTQKIQVVK